MQKIDFKKLDFKLIINNFKDNLKAKKVQKINQKTKIDFFDSVFSLINSWIPITNSLSIMMYQAKDKTLKDLLWVLLRDLSKWKKLQDSFKDYPKIFSNFDIYIIKMWEVTWKLANSLEIIRDREEKNKDLKSKILSALIYPIIIIILSISMIVWFMVFVIPKVEKMYVDARVNLPSLTQNVINTANFLKENWIYLIAIIFILVLILSSLRHHKKTKYYFDKAFINIPFFGNLIKKKTLAIFSNTLWVLLSNWIMINEALEIAKKSVDNDYYERRIDEMCVLLNEWIPLSDLMWINKLKDWLEDKYFPLELASIVKIWEQTWKLPSLLVKISNKYNKEIDVIVKNLSTVIEPLVIVVVGWIVWTMVMAILLPFFNMVNVV